MNTRFKMVMVPNSPKELRAGMLCRSISDDSEPNTFYFLSEGMDMTYEGLHESVIPFIVSKDDAQQTEDDKIYLFNFEDGGFCIAKPVEIYDKNDVVSYRELVVGPEQIGLVKGDGGNREITIEDINSIMSNEGWCYVDMDDEFTAPEKFTHVGWGDSVPEVKLIDGKCLITLDNK